MASLLRWFAQRLRSRRFASLVVGVTLLLTTFSVTTALRIESDDDMLAFLPQDNALIAQFTKINKEFSGLSVAIIGVETDDVYAPQFLSDLQQATNALAEIPELNHVLSLTNVEDFTVDPGRGIVTKFLVDPLPKTQAASEALRKRVEQRDMIVGSLVSEDGRGSVIYAFAGYGTDQRALTKRITNRVTQHLSGNKIYWGGAPFVSTHIYDATQADMRLLTPWAVLAIVTIMLLSFRDLIGTMLGLASTGIGISVTYATMVATQTPLNIILGSMPILLFAIGSAYGIHLLARYHIYALEMPVEEAIEKMLVVTGPKVITAGVTTAIGLGSFMLMDIEPLRDFGAFTALGVLAALVTSLTFIPAVIRLVELKGRSVALDRFSCWAVWFARFCQKRRRLLISLLVLVTVLSCFTAARVDNRMDLRAFYSEGSEPDAADKFLNTYFGGSQFIQILVEGDLSSPHVLRQIRRMEQELMTLSGVSQVQHIGQPVALLNGAMEGIERIPDSAEKVSLLFSLLSTNRAMEQLMSADQGKALVNIRLNSNDLDSVEHTLKSVESWLDSNLAVQFAVHAVSDENRHYLEEQVVNRMIAVASGLGLSADIDIRQAVLTSLEHVSNAADPDQISPHLIRFLQSSESMVPLTTPQAVSMADLLAALGPGFTDNQLVATARDVLGPEASDLDVEDLSWSVAAPIEEAWRFERGLAAIDSISRAAGWQLSDLANPDSARLTLAAVYADLGSPDVMIESATAPTQLTYTVSGLPVMHRGLSQSVSSNQLKAMSVALVLVALLLAVAFRSLSAGLLATAPIALTLLLIYGAMGALGIHLDIGTSMLASLVVGVGVDYAVHLQSAWYATDDEDVSDGAARAAARTGAAIWINAVMVSVGFVVLTFGQARPLQNFGLLTAAAMMTAALMTFVVIPILAKRRCYDQAASEVDPADRVLVSYGGPIDSPQPS